ncbi:Hypothetical protein NGAL_HAMBI1146_15770 [Neorhizobium galegae bv. officinalis]|nr:Hypothetical protein NGAL_HAMBI1146_15770 [Neorhizobium galegae bv. officinalis]
MSENIVTEQKFGLQRHFLQPIKSRLAISISEDHLLLVTMTNRREGKDLGALWINLEVDRQAPINK